MAEKLARIQDIDGKSFDYVIVGGGITGCVLANRLSEDPNVTVALLEAGKAHIGDPYITSPLSFAEQLHNPEYDWAFPVVPQKHAPKTHLYPWNRGKSLGGSSAVNLVAWTKPAREDMDAVEALGNPGWNWESYQKYINKAEGFRPPKPRAVDDGFQDLYNPDSVGHNGPLTLCFVPTGTGADKAFQEGLAKLGIPVISDAMGGDIIGSWKGTSTIDPDNGRRIDAATAYLLPILDRPNLKVLTEAYAGRVLTEGEKDNVVARGVEFEYGGQQRKVSAKREVILAAGAIKSPQILELSGIGDRKVLEPLGIRTVIDLPGVGSNSQEHHICRAPFFRMKEGKGVVSAHQLTDEAYMAELKKLHKLDHDYNVVLNALAFAPLKAVSDKADEIIAKKKALLAKNWDSYSPGRRKQYEAMLQRIESNKGIDVEYLVTGPRFRHILESRNAHMGAQTNLTHPWSRGTIHITTTDPKVDPAVDPHFLEDEIDLDILTEGFKFILKVTRSPPFSDLVEAELTPGPDVDLSTDEKAKEYVRNNISATWHTCGTCSMLPKELDGVVDPKLRVYGTKNLRVADLSVLPILVAVHTQAVVYGMAEQAADIIKATVPTY